MRRIILLISFSVLAAWQVNAQKFMTRTGKISFFSSTPVENIEAFNNEVSGIVDAQSGEVVFIVPVKSFRFEKALMQEHFNDKYMESDRFPKADFKGKIISLNEINFAKEGSYNATLRGKLTIHGVTKDVSLPGKVSVKGNTITAFSQFKVKTADYKIRIPKMVEGKIAREIEVTVDCILNQR